MGKDNRILVFSIISLLFLTLQVDAQLNLSFAIDTNMVCNGQGCNYNGPSILINEVMTMPQNGDGSICGNNQNGEWIELYNPDICKPVDISCYFLGNNAPDGGGNHGGGFELPEGTVVPPRGFVMVRGTAAPPVPSNLLLQNGGRTIEIVVQYGTSVCYDQEHNGKRLWFPNAGGWFAFYNAQGVPQDAISWNDLNNSELGGHPCNPAGNCPFTDTLCSYNQIPSNRKTYIDYEEADMGLSYRRLPDGGAWAINQQAAATYGTCNATCIPPPIITCTGSATVQVSGGTPPYSYKWNDNQLQSTQTAVGLCGGLYCVTVTDSQGHVKSACVTIPDYTFDVVIGTIPAQICENASPVMLTGGTPAGGFFSGPGVSNNILNPSVAGAGNHYIEYIVLTADSCGGSDSALIDVLPAENVTFGTISPVCAGTNPFSLLTGYPAGGIYSGPGVTSGIFDPLITGPGSFAIKYKLLYSNGCKDSAYQNAVVYPLPVVDIAPLQAICISSDTFQLSGGTPAGGTYSGHGVLNGIFDPAIAGTGAHTITYSYTDNHNCVNSDSTTIVVNPLPVVGLTPLASVCLNAATYALTGGTPTGGTYTGTGVVSNNFVPSSAGVGTYIITYHYKDVNGCVDSVDNSITVLPLPLVTFTAIPPLCSNVLPITLTQGSPPGGTYSGPGVTNGKYDPSVTGPGSFTLSYSFKDNNGCTNTANQNVGVYLAPVVTLSLVDTVCESTAPFPLSGGLPAGGTYSGIGVANNVFNPNVAGPGTYILKYKYININLCTDSAYDTVFVAESPVVTFPDLPDICANADTLILSGGVPAGGTYYGEGVSNGSFNPGITGPGNQYIMYTYSIISQCPGLDTANIMVLSVPVVTMDSLNPVCENAHPFILTGGLPQGGTYSGPGIVAGELDPKITGDSTFYIYYSFTDTNNCTNIDSSYYRVNPLPVKYKLTGGGMICDRLDSTAVGLVNSEINVRYTLSLNGISTGIEREGTGSALTLAYMSDSGTYTVYAFYLETGCKNVMDSSIYVSYIRSPHVRIIDSTWLCDENGVVVDAGTFEPDTVTYLWTDGGTERYFTAKDTGFFWVVVQNKGCSGSDTVHIKPCCDIWLPNVFTPNSDDRNERFLPVKKGEIISYRIEIFNRWGKVVYRSDDMNEGWDGTLFNEGKKCAEGAYYYVAYFRGYGYGDPPPEFLRTGSVTLLR